MMDEYCTLKSCACPNRWKLLVYISMSKRPRGTSTPTWSKDATTSPAPVSSVYGLSMSYSALLAGSSSPASGKSSASFGMWNEMPTSASSARSTVSSIGSCIMTSSRPRVACCTSESGTVNAT